MIAKYISRFNLLIVLALALALVLAGCGSPDTSAPERTVLKRSADWRGALLYIADAQGPDPEFGSVRVYDNVSGFVEKTVEQNLAASPSDVYVSPDGGSMYVASSANGEIDSFRWDGNNWVHDHDIETPAASLETLVRGPDKLLYAAGALDSRGPARLFYRLDPAAGKLAASVSFPELSSVSGISWSPDGASAYIAGTATSGAAQLAVYTWPSRSYQKAVALPGIKETHEVVTSPDGRFVYVMCRGKLLKIDAAKRTLAGALTPDPNPQADYYGAAFSADGRYLFTDATDPGGSESTLYIIDLNSNNVVKTVNKISVDAKGMKRTE